jgi:hypothetical protein
MEPERPISFAQAIGAGADVFASARRALHTLPASSDATDKGLHTVEGALREQEQRLHSIPAPALKAPKPRSRSGSTPTEVPRGYRIGVAQVTSPYWLLVEVRRARRSPPPSPVSIAGASPPAQDGRVPSACGRVRGRCS